VTLTSLDQRHGVPFIIAVTGLVFCCHKSAIQYLRHLVHGLSLQRPGFSVRAVHVGFMLGRMALGRRDEVMGEWRRLHNKELNDLYSSHNIVWVIKSRRMRLAGHVTRMGEERGVYRILVGKLEGKKMYTGET